LIKFKLKITSGLNLGIDLGNTMAKFYLFDGDKILFQQKANSSSFDTISSKLINENPEIKEIIYSDVVGIIAESLKKYAHKIKIIPIGSQMRLPFTNLYQNQNKLGADRILLIASAAKAYPKSNVLVIDLGSCITYDFLDQESVYQGGAISPGFMMRYKALSHFTANLPIANYKTPKTPQGKSTYEAIQSGVYFAILDEINSRIEYYKKNYKSLKVVFTGGDVNKLPKTLKNSIFASLNFIADGMLHLLKLNRDL